MPQYGCLFISAETFWKKTVLAEYWVNYSVKIHIRQKHHSRTPCALKPAWSNVTIKYDTDLISANATEVVFHVTVMSLDTIDESSMASKNRGLFLSIP